MLIVAIFSFESGERLELNSKRLYRSLEKEEESRCLVFMSSNLVPRSHSVLPWEIWVRDYTSSTKREIGHFHVVVEQWRQRNVQKNVMHVQSYCFADRNLLVFAVLVDVAVVNESGGKKKNNRFRSAKQKLCPYVTLFCALLCRHCPTSTWNCLISRFCGVREDKDNDPDPRLVFFF